MAKEFLSAGMQPQVAVIPVGAETLQAMIDQSVERAFEKFLPKKKEYLTRQEVCERFSVTLPTIHSWVNRGLITACKISGRTLFDALELEKAVQEKNVFKYKHSRR